MGDVLKQVVLGVSGSIAAYRACDLTRDLMRAGCSVRACLTDSANRFVSRELFEALTGNPCLEDVFEEPERGRMAHIDCARSADALIICPATANTINQLAAGTANDMLTSLALAYEGPIVIAPAMNPSMYGHPATQSALQTLRARGAVIVEPTEGDVACGENGQGKLAPNAAILQAALELIEVSRIWEGKTILVTLGPTREPIDDVRFLTNRSSGKMGIAVVRAALMMGAKVAAVAGPLSIPVPRGAEIVSVESAQEMADAVQARIADIDLLVGVAAVSDYRPEERVQGKIRSGQDLTLKLKANPDILAEASSARPELPIVGFAAEPSSSLEAAQTKRLKKGLLAIAHNDVGAEGIGFESDENALTLIWDDGRIDKLEKQSKFACAAWLLRLIRERVPT